MSLLKVLFVLLYLCNVVSGQLIECEKQDFEDGTAGVFQRECDATTKPFLIKEYKDYPGLEVPQNTNGFFMTTNDDVMSCVQSEAEIEVEANTDLIIRFYTRNPNTPSILLILVSDAKNSTSVLTNMIVVVDNQQTWTTQKVAIPRAGNIVLKLQCEVLKNKNAFVAIDFIALKAKGADDCIDPPITTTTVSEPTVETTNILESTTATAVETTTTQESTTATGVETTTVLESTTATVVETTTTLESTTATAVETTTVLESTTATAVETTTTLESTTAIAIETTTVLESTTVTAVETTTALESTAATAIETSTALESTTATEVETSTVQKTTTENGLGTTTVSGAESTTLDRTETTLSGFETTSIGTEKTTINTIETTTVNGPETTTASGLESTTPNTGTTINSETTTIDGIENTTLGVFDTTTTTVDSTTVVMMTTPIDTTTVEETTPVVIPPTTAPPVNSSDDQLWKIISITLLCISLICLFYAVALTTYYCTRSPKSSTGTGFVSGVMDTSNSRNIPRLEVQKKVISYDGDTVIEITGKSHQS